MKAFVSTIDIRPQSQTPEFFKPLRRSVLQPEFRPLSLFLKH